MTAVLFWLLRALGVFATLASVFFFWRASVVVGACLLCDFIAMIAGIGPSASFWTQGRLLFVCGLMVGLVEIGRRDEAVWHFPLLAAVVLALLTLSWMGSPEGSSELASTWPLQSSRVLAMPLGMLGIAAVVRSVERARRAWTHLR